MSSTTSSAVALAAGLMLSTWVAAATPPNAEGLVEVRVRGLQQFLVQPGADLSRYRNILLDPVEVAFDRRWEPKVNGRDLSVEERTKIRADIARVLQKEFTSELSQGGYQVVTEPGADVLRLRVEVRDLYLNAPDVQGAVRSMTYARSVGTMKLAAEMRDSASGALIGRAVDRYEDPEKSFLEWTTSIDNAEAARDAAEQWARALRSQLDKARAAKPDKGLEASGMSEPGTARR